MLLYRKVRQTQGFFVFWCRQFYLRYDDKERLVSLGCSYAAEFEGEEYDEFIGVVISDMRQFLHRVREKGDGFWFC